MEEEGGARRYSSPSRLIAWVDNDFARSAGGAGTREPLTFPEKGTRDKEL